MHAPRALFSSLAIFAILIAAFAAASPATAAVNQPNSIGFVARVRLQAERLVLRDTTLYAGYTHFAIADVSDVRNIKILDQIFNTPYIYDIALDGQYAYTAQQGLGVRNLDVLVDTISEFTAARMPGGAQGVALAGGVLYAANGNQGVRLLDATKPADLTEIGQIKAPGFSNCVTVSGTILFVCSSTAGIRLYDVTNAKFPVELGALALPGYANSITVDRTLAYVADGNAGVRLVDTTDPRKPKEIGAFVTPGTARRVALRGQYAYVAASAGGLLILDVSDPTRPVQAARYVSDGAPGDLALLDDTIFVANMPNGIDVLTWTPPVRADLNTAASQLASEHDQVVYSFPDGAFGGPTRVTHQALLQGSAQDGGAYRSKAGAFFTVSAVSGSGAIEHTLKPFTIQAPYRENVDPRLTPALSLYGWNGFDWIKIASSVDAANNRVTATTDWLTTYGVFLDRAQPIKK